MLPCGREINYIHCDDLPVVFSQLLSPSGQVVQDVADYGSGKEESHGENGKKLLSQENGTASSSSSLSLAFGGTHSLTVPFQPSSLCMLPASGRVYHAGPEALGGVGLVKSSLAIELSKFFVYEEGAEESAHPVQFRWRGEMWDLDRTVLDLLHNRH